jgi:drug/metabolite transporter (DMT)-like permease
MVQRPEHLILDFTVFLAVIAAAFMHASWNLLVKLKLDRFLSLFLLQTLMGFMGIAMLLFFAWPSPVSLPYAFVSGLLHTGYNIFLARSYRHGDLSQVYPIARGTAPLLTLLMTWLVAHDQINIHTVLGIIVLVSGIWLVAVGKTMSVRLDRTTLLYALGTSAFIAAYTVVDGLGGRMSGAASGYTGVVFILDAIFLCIVGFYTRGPSIFRDVAPFWKSGLVGAALSAGAYWIVIWAMTETSIASVAALRETSILFVILMSAKFLKESLGWTRVLGGVLVVAGAVALRLS